MASEIQIVNISNLEKIESFINDSAYKEVLENSENFNTRLCIERRLRMPFLDPQTGVAQNHCALFHKQRQRMPGHRDGQLYTYPSARWRKSRRQYLLHQHRPFKVVREPDIDSMAGLDGSSLGAGDTDSKDSHRDDPKDWYFDEMDMHDVDPFDDRDPDSDFDYEDNFSRKKKRGRKTGVDTPGPKKSKGNSIRGRRKKQAFDGDFHTPMKRGRPGPPPPQLPPNNSNSPLNCTEEPQMPVLTPEQTIPEEEERVRKPMDQRNKAHPSPYCDFCLGDARENKKIGGPEELVSCSDCGRSGHPSCLQFTPNMIISVKKYRWQCIECKYCSICGTSDNDDQLLFCDDCDRGYHMYCLSPPLTAPPEGSWSCKLCQAEFHSNKK